MHTYILQSESRVGNVVLCFLIAEVIHVLANKSLFLITKVFL